jgi:ribosome recycling factor
MNQELEQVEIALHTQQQEQALYEIYGAAPTYTEEVRSELTKSLEHLYAEDSAKNISQTSTDTSQKILYLAVKALMETGCNETYIIEKVLKKRGRNWGEGNRMLQELLQQGQQNEW